MRVIWSDLTFGYQHLQSIVVQAAGIIALDRVEEKGCYHSHNRRSSPRGLIASALTRTSP